MSEQARAEALNEELLALLRKSAHGDQIAFQRLYEKTSGRMYAVALRLMRRADLADEVMQEAYVRIWHNASEYVADRGAVLTWMVSIARYRGIDRLRKLKRELVMEDADDYQDKLVDDSMEPLQFIDAAADAKLLHGCLEELVDKQKHSIALAFFDGLTHEQLSLHLDAPLGTVKSWIRRGLILLRQCLDNELQQPRTH
jgi:RNA polymerase sigma-70 factor (ECF subfamily)